MTTKDPDHDAPEPGSEVRYVHRCEHEVVLERDTPQGTQIITAQPHAEGQPIPPGHSFAHVMPDTSSRTGYRMHVLHRPHGGPARANSAAYRSGYDAIFGKSKRGEA